MWCTAVSLFLLLGLVTSQNEDANSRPSKLVCYFGSWSLQGEGENRFAIDDIDPTLCTHIIYGFAILDDDNRISPSAPSLELDDNDNEGFYSRFNGLKQRNGDLTTMIAVGGWWDNSTKYSVMSSSAVSRRNFVENVVGFLTIHGFGGLDVSWDFPAHRGGRPEDKENFVLLLQELKEALNSNGYLLSVTVAGDVAIADKAYDVANVTKSVDFINLMTYDYDFGYWANYTSYIDPLYGRPDEEERQKTYNANYTVHYWLDRGASADKLVLGVSLYWRLYTLSNASQHKVGDPVTGPPRNIRVTEECVQPMEGEGSSWNIQFDKTQVASYAYRDVQWISMESNKALKIKVKYVEDLGLAGLMASSMEMDDFRGKCYGFPYPFLTALAQNMNLVPTVEPAPSD